MRPILFLYWNWLQGLIERRSKNGGAALFFVPGFLWIFLPAYLDPLWFLIVTFVVGGAWVWPLMIFHKRYWDRKQ